MAIPQVVACLTDLQLDTSRRLEALKREQAGINAQVSATQRRLNEINEALRLASA